MFDDDDDEYGRVCMGCGYLDCECDEPPDDCMNCGTCEDCIQRSIGYAEEHG